MKALFLGLLFAIGIALSGCANCHKCELPHMAADLPEPREQVLKLAATVDGSGRIIFNGDSARYEHKFWTPPWNVTFDGEAWTDLNQTPAGWSELSRQLDLAHARIVSRSGRDVIALEPTAEGFDLYLNDTPNGAADYSVTIAIPRRE
jgi:hypothetical protein